VIFNAEDATQAEETREEPKNQDNSLSSRPASREVGGTARTTGIGESREPDPARVVREAKEIRPVGSGK
jgi:hypothetical protein